MVKWYFAYNQETEDLQDPLIRCAVASSKRFGDISANAIVSGEDEDSRLVSWMRRMGVNVIFARSSLYDSIEAYKKVNPRYNAAAAKGAYLRFEVPLIENDEQYVLYTDTDVIFWRGMDIEKFRPKYFSVAPQNTIHDYMYPNSGVMWINVESFRSRCGKLFDFCKCYLPEFRSHDQAAMQSFFYGQWDRLAPEYNWKPYWGVNKNARIIHFHGPKITNVPLLQAGDDSPLSRFYRPLYDKCPPAYDYYYRAAQKISDYYGDAPNS